MAKPEYYYGVHSVESLLELEPERVLTLFALKGREDQRLQQLAVLADPLAHAILAFKIHQVQHDEDLVGKLRLEGSYLVQRGEALAVVCEAHALRVFLVHCCLMIKTEDVEEEAAHLPRAKNKYLHFLLLLINYLHLLSY